jgi:hypothetical protein
MAVEEVARIVGKIRAHWLRVKINLRADSGLDRLARKGRERAPLLSTVAARSESGCDGIEGRFANLSVLCGQAGSALWQHRQLASSLPGSTLLLQQDYSDWWPRSGWSNGLIQVSPASATAVIEVHPATLPIASLLLTAGPLLKNRSALGRPVAEGQVDILTRYTFGKLDMHTIEKEWAIAKAASDVHLEVTTWIGALVSGLRAKAKLELGIASIEKRPWPGALADLCGQIRHIVRSFHPVDRFYNEKNMARYRKLASEAVTDMERTRLLGLLDKEMDEFTDLQKTRAWRPTTRPH